MSLHFHRRRRNRGKEKAPGCDLGPIEIREACNREGKAGQDFAELFRILHLKGTYRHVSLQPRIRKKKGYRLKIYDAYRPQMAVSHFARWAKDFKDTRMKPYFYPELKKDVLFPLGYIAERSGHSRGSTVDLTLFDMKTEKEVDMGGTFDYFGELSHPDYTKITTEQFRNRMILREAMLSHGFKPLVEEWWHFTLKDEPYPDTYFTFPVTEASVERETKAVPQEVKPAA